MTTIMHRAQQILRPACLTLITLAANPLSTPADTLPRVLTGPVAGVGPHLKGFEYRGDHFAPISSPSPYDPAFLGGITVAIGDFNGDGVPEFVVGTSTLSSHVKVLHGHTLQEIHSFFAFPSFTGGVNVAAGDVNGDGKSDLIVSPASGGSQIKVFDGVTLSPLGSFFPYDSAFSGGVTVASGDINGDGLDDLVTGTASSSTHVKVFLAPEFSPAASFFAYPSASTGVFVAAGDVNGDGAADVITGAGPGGGPHVKVFSGTNQAVLASFFAYDISATHGVRVASADLDGDTADDIVTSLGSGSDLVRVYSGGSVLLDEINAYDGAGVGVFVAAHSALAVPPATHVRPRQGLHIATSGVGYQALVFNYHDSELAVSPYASSSGGVLYSLTDDQWMGLFLYDYSAQAFTQALYQVKRPL